MLPSVAPSRDQVGIVHLGVGNFHRSHQAMYLARYLDLHPQAPWAISGVGVQTQDIAIAHAMQMQDCLYSLTLVDSDGPQGVSIIGSIAEYLYCPEAPSAVLRRMISPSTKIVSLTITESGYPEDPSTGRTIATDDQLLRDLHEEFREPRTAFGLIVGALKARRRRGIPPFTVVSCDNIQRNGELARANAVSVARCVDPGLAAWIEEGVAFPSSMVDRITPRPSPAQQALVERELLLPDQIPVIAEPFCQWVLEDTFPCGRPSLEEVGVTFVDSVDAYETMKLRLLNGGHQVLAYLGLLAGHEYAHHAMADRRIASILRCYLRDLVLPTLQLPRGVDGHDYIRSVSHRFSNAALGDKLERLATDSVSRMAKFVLPTLVGARLHPSYLSIVPVVLASWFEVVRTTRSTNILSDVPSALRAMVRQGAKPSEALTAARWFMPLWQDQELMNAVDTVWATM